MVRILIALLLGVALTAPTIQANDGLECVLSVFQSDKINSEQVLLHRDTVELVKDLSTVGSMLAFSIEIQVTSVDSNQASFILHLVTVGQPVSNFSRRYRVEYGLPARLDNIPGKGDAEYSFEVLPLRLVDIDTTYCGYRHTDPDHFRFDPTAHLDIHYVPFTYGDFFWNTVKGLMETEYRRFKDLNRFTLPGKYTLFLCPCRIPSVIWDKRFGMMVDATRNTMFSTYAKTGNSTHPFLVMQASILRNYGYAPPFLSEGYAGYLSDALFAMKEIVSSGRNLRMDSLLDTYTYLHSDPVIADKTAATFVRYLIEQYRIDRFLELYRQADDLNLRKSLENVYGKSVADLEQEWIHFVDTITIKVGQLRYYADQAEVMFDFGLMLDYAQAEMSLATSRNDSITILPTLIRSMFFNGDYYGAAANQEQLLKLDSNSAEGWMKLAGYLMMNGYYERAGEVLERAKSLDSSDQVIDFNRAINRKLLGDEQAAREILTGIIDFPKEYSPQVEGRIFLADLLMATGDQSDRTRAENYFREAIAILGKTVQTGHPSSQHQLWNGIAHLGLGDTGAAWDYLQTAIYLETRPFYEGMASLWMGKLADVRGERDVARHYYGTVLSLASADYHQREARKYLETPYTP